MNNLGEKILIIISILLSIVPIILGLFLAAVFLILGKITCSKILFKYGFNLAYSIDQFGNALLLGDPDETISSRTGRALLSGRSKWFVKPFGLLVDGLALLFGDKNHIKKSVEVEQVISKQIWNWEKKES